MKVEVRPLPITKWHGKEGKDSFTLPKVLEVLVDSNTGRYATGLTLEEQKEYSEKLGVDLSDRVIPEVGHDFWGTKAAQIKLENRTMVFDTTRPSDFVKVKNMKASSRVANSMKDWEAGHYPNATHVIFDEQEDIDIKATKVQKKQKCFAIIADMSLDTKASIVQILSEKTVRGRSANFIDVQLEEIINNKPDEFLRYAEMDKQQTYTRATLLEAIHRGVLTKEGMALYYMGDRIANDFEEAVGYFNDPQNQMMKAKLLEKLQ